MISLISGLISFAPYLVKKLMGDKASETAKDVLDIAKSVTGIEDDDKAVEVINSNPEIALKFKESVLSYQSLIYQEDTKRLEAVNRTQQIEYETKGKFKTCWRPYWGWVSGTMFGIQMLSFCLIGIIAIWKNPAKAMDTINALASLAGALATTWIFALSVLGVAVIKRSEDKQVALGNQPVSIIKTVLSKILK